MLGKLKGLSKIKKLTGGIGLAIVGLTIIGAASPQPPSQPTATKQTVTPSTQSSGKVQGDSTTLTPQFTTQTVTETQTVPYQTTTQDDPNLPSGQTKVLTAGVNGSETLTYTVTYTDGQQTSKQLINTTVTTPPVNEVVAKGTYVASASTPSTTATVPTPTPSPVPTPAPAPRLIISFTCGSAIDYSSGTVCVHTEPGAALTITVTYCSGYSATSQSLRGTDYADTSGNYTWNWTPETKCRGAATALVSASWQGQTANNSMSLTVQ